MKLSLKINPVTELFKEEHNLMISDSWQCGEERYDLGGNRS